MVLPALRRRTSRRRGEIVLFDRSWYNRAGVEIVMGFCTPQEYGEFFRQAPGFERSIVESGTHLFKFWFTVSRANQIGRFERRKTDPLRQWKFSPVDEASLGKWDEYTRARDAMLIHTDSPASPWIVINSNEKKRARLESIRHVVSSLDYDHKDHDVASRVRIRWSSSLLAVMTVNDVPPLIRPDDRGTRSRGPAAFGRDGDGPKAVFGCRCPALQSSPCPPPPRGHVGVAELADAPA